MSAHKTRIAAVTAFLLAGASSMAAAQGFDPAVERRGGAVDPMMANRYPAFAGPVQGGNLASRDVRLQSRAAHHAVSPRAGESWMERASKTWDGGGY